MEATLVIALVSLVLSAASVLSQLWHFRRSGPRLKIRLIPAVLTHTGTLVRGPDDGWSAAPPERRFGARDELWVDVAELRVENRGRLPVSVSDVGLSFEPRLNKLPWTITGKPIAVHGGVEDGRSLRLEPGESRSVFVFVWPLLAWGLAEVEGDTLRVRASATAVGRPRPLRSATAAEWKVRRGALQLYPHAEVTRHVQTFQAIAHAWPTSDITKLYEAWLDIWTVLTGYGSEDLSSVVRRFVPSAVGSMQLTLQLRSIMPSAQVQTAHE